jgi:hypothetical protein
VDTGCASLFFEGCNSLNYESDIRNENVQYRDLFMAIFCNHCACTCQNILYLVNWLKKEIQYAVFSGVNDGYFAYVILFVQIIVSYACIFLKCSLKLPLTDIVMYLTVYHTYSHTMQLQ